MGSTRVFDRTAIVLKFRQRFNMSFVLVNSICLLMFWKYQQVARVRVTFKLTGAIDSQLGTNHMKLAIEDCSTLKVRGTGKELHLAWKPPATDNEVKDLAITVSEKLPWTAHVNNRPKKARQVFHSIRRNVAFKMNTSIEPRFFKSPILKILLYGLDCLTPAKSGLQNLEKF